MVFIPTTKLSALPFTKKWSCGPNDCSSRSRTTLVAGDAAVNHQTLLLTASGAGQNANAGPSGDTASVSVNVVSHLSGAVHQTALACNRIVAVIQFDAVVHAIGALRLQTGGRAHRLSVDVVDQAREPSEAKPAKLIVAKDAATKHY